VFNRTQVITKSSKVVAARNVNLAATYTSVNFDKDGIVYSPLDPILLTATAHNTTGSVWYQFFKDDVDQTGIQSDNFYEVPGTDATGPGENATWKVQIRDGTNLSSGLVRAEGSLTISGIKSGADAYKIASSNDNTSITADLWTKTFTGTGEKITTFKGTQQLDNVITSTYDSGNDVYNYLGNYVGNLGYSSASIFYKDSWITLPISKFNLNPAEIGNITDWNAPATNKSGQIVYKIDFENGRQSQFVTQSVAVQFTAPPPYDAKLTNENSSAVYKVSGQFTTTGTGTFIRVYRGNTELTNTGTMPATDTDAYGTTGLSKDKCRVSVYSKSAHINLAGGLVPGSWVSGTPASMANLAGWTDPASHPTAEIVYQIDCEGRQTLYKTQSISIQYEGSTGPGIVMRGEWKVDTNYIGSVETSDYRIDAVIYGTNPTTYYASVSGSGPGTHDGMGNLVGPQTPSGTTTDTSYWKYLGTESFFVAAKLAIFDKSYVKETLNVGTYGDTSEFANVIIAGGRTDPYIAIGQHGTYGTSGGGYSPTNPAVIGYDQEGIFLGIFEDGSNGTFGRMSIKDSSGTNYMKWDGTSLILSGLLNAGGMKLGRGVNGSNNGLYLNGNNYWYDSGTDFKVGGSSNYLAWDGSNLILKGSLRQTSGGVNEGRVLGAWVSGYAYLTNDIVSNAGRTWHALSDHTSGATTEPYVGASYATYWALAADAGTSGTAGTAGGPGATGPGVVYRGDYNSGTSYVFSDGVRRDIVKYSGAFYLTKANTTGNAPTNTSYWEPFGATFSSVATDVLLAQDASIYRGLVIGTDGATNGFIRTTGATSLTAGNGFYLAQDGQFRFGNDTTLTGANYVSWNNVALTIKGQLITNNSQLGNWLVDGTILRDSTSKMKLNPDIPALEIYDGSGNKKVDIKQGSLSDPAGGSVTIGIQPVSFDWDYLSANYPSEYPSYFNSSTFSYNSEYYPKTSNTLNVSTSGTYYKLSPSWGYLGFTYDTNGTFSGNVTADIYAEIHTVPNPVDYSTVVAQWHIGQGNTITGTYASGYITTLNYNSYISLNAGTYYVITKIIFTGYIHAGSLAVTGTTTPNNVNYSLSLDQIEITDEGILVVSGADNYVRIARSTSQDMITIKQNSTTKAAIVAANSQGTGYNAINVTSGDIYAAGMVTAGGRLYMKSFDTNPSGVSNDPVKVITQAGARYGELFRSTSTRKDKKDIIDWSKTNILDKIKLVEPKTFRYKNWQDTEEPVLGMIAEDLRDNGLEEAAMFERDENGIKTKEVTSIDWERISVILWKAVQELTERIEKLESK
jgi:hypothetical protein